MAPVPSTPPEERVVPAAARGGPRVETKRLVVVANRLPVRRVGEGDEERWETSPGGLVSAMEPILKRRDGCWVGWPGVPDEIPPPFVHDGIRQVPVGLTQDDLERFYEGFANGTLWPLYHDAVRPPEFHRHWWWPYVEVNRRFAEAAAEVVGPGDVVWIHDYQLQLVPTILRRLRPDARIGFFLHIPFPPVELFAQIPWRRQILEGLLGADVIGFQTRFGASNFARAARRFTAARGSDKLLEFDGRWVRVDGFPISIDIKRYANLASDPAVRRRASEIQADLGGRRRILLGVDRLDYTKGIDVRLRAFETFLAKNEDAVDEAVFVQVAVPSREEVTAYGNIRTEIEQAVGHINGKHGRPGKVPVHYLYRNLDPEELVAFYVAADVMCVTPFRDGMNLVAKEYVATRLDGDGVLVLSEFAGAAQEFTRAVLVNPHDIDGVATAIERAIGMPEAERKRRMAALRQRLRRNDVHDWANHFLELLHH